MNPILWPLRTGLRFIRDIDGLFSYFSFKLFPKTYVIEGACQKRGICCQNIAICLSPSFWKHSWLKRLAQRYYTFVYNFQHIEDLEEHKVIKFKCNYLKEGKCSIYRRRPFICRQYPALQYFQKPEILPGCGYRIVAKNKK
ncbi:hypothetical protein HOH87_02650 [bacterium]|nr:hypothetical protein [bacterium]